MKAIFAEMTASITELKKNPSGIIRDAGDKPVAILNHNTPTAYLLSADSYEKLMDMLDDVALRKIVEERRACMKDAVSVDIDEL